MSLTKKLTIFITTLLATLCAVFSVATLRPATAFAATENSTARFDDKALIFGEDYIHYSWQYDPNGYYTEDIKVVLNINLYEKGAVSTGWESVDQNVTFSDLSTSSYNKLESHEITIYYEYSPRSTVARKNGIEHTYSYNKVTLEPLIYIGKADKGSFGRTPVKSWFSYDVENEIITDKFTIDFVIKTQSPYTNYVLGISTTIDSYDRGTGTLFSDRDYKGTLDSNGVQKPFTSVSPIKSLANIVNTAVENNSYVMEYTPTDYDVKGHIDNLYNKLIEQALEREFTVYYLEPIAENIPYAKKVSQDITITVDKTGSANAVDVCKALGVEYFEIFGTVYNAIEEDDATLTVKYPCDLWLASKTVDGKTQNHFLNINVSFQEYFYPLVSDGVIEESLYEWLFAHSVGNVYPEVAKQGLSYADVYGYWDYVVLPETVGLNSLLADVLGTETNYIGFTKEFHFEGSITAQAYNTLLKNYQYSWLENAWNSLIPTGTETGTYNATHYIVVCDPILKDAFIDAPDSGDKNPGGSTGEQAFDGIKKFFEDTFNFIGDFFTGKGPAGTYIIIVVVGGAVLFGLYLVKGGKLPSFSSSSKPRKVKSTNKPRKTRSSASKSKTRSKTYGKTKKK